MKKSIQIVIVVAFGLAIIIGCKRQEATQPITGQVNETKNTDVIAFQASGHFDKVIGEIHNGKITFVADVKEIKTHWQNVVNGNSDLHVSFQDIWIVKEEDGFYLRGRDTVNHASSIVKLVLDGSKFFECKYILTKSEVGGYTITCSGFTNTGPGSAGECEVALNPGVGYYCTDCSEGTCTKTVTYTGGGGVTG